MPRLLLLASAIALWAPIHFASAHSQVTAELSPVIGDVRVIPNVVIVDGAVRKQLQGRTPFDHVLFGIAQLPVGMIDAEIQNYAMLFLRCDAIAWFCPVVVDQVRLLIESEIECAGKQLPACTDMTSRRQSIVFEPVGPTLRACEISRVYFSRMYGSRGMPHQSAEGRRRVG
jgi:hypothetical protein